MKKHSAVFLDRDGVLCVEKSYITSVEDLSIFPYAKYCIELLHQKKFLAICVTNQSAVARGMMTEKVLQELNQHLIEKIGLDAVYYCPHHPNGIGKYKCKCSCRKPNTGMIERAIKEFEIDRNNSYIVGDRASDIICGQRSGLKTVLVESGYGLIRLEESVKADFVCSDLKEFIESKVVIKF